MGDCVTGSVPTSARGRSERVRRVGCPDSARVSRWSQPETVAEGVWAETPCPARGFVEPPVGVEPATYALRDPGSPVHWCPLMGVHEGIRGAGCPRDVRRIPGALLPGLLPSRPM